MAIKNCKDIKYDMQAKAAYFDGTAQSIKELQTLVGSEAQLNLNTLHTKIGWWAVRYQDGGIVWKRSSCFSTNYKVEE